MGACMIEGGPQDLAAACAAEPRCSGFSAFPHGSSDLPVPMGYLLSGARPLDLGFALWQPQAVLYVHNAPAPSPQPSSATPPARSTLGPSPARSPAEAAAAAPAAPAPAPADGGGSGAADGSAGVDAAPLAGGSPASAQPASQQGGRKPLKGLPLAGKWECRGSGWACFILTTDTSSL